VDGPQVEPVWQQSPAVRQGPVALEQQVPWAEQADAPPALPQQSLPNRHALPTKEHWQSPVATLQSPPQHCVLSVQPKLIGRQQVPPTHWSLPQQLKPEQVAPSGMQQVPWLQAPVQHGPVAPQLLPSR
jgi:hypothetical protein